MENKDIIFEKSFINKQMADSLFTDLYTHTVWHSILKNQDGEDIKINRSMAYEKENYQTGDVYNYANLSLPSSPLSTPTNLLIEFLEDSYYYKFNSCLLNLYHNGKSEIRYHSDSEPQLGVKPVIASINFGAPRTFHVLHKESGRKEQYLLEHGDLFIMLENFQTDYLHAVLKEKHVTEPRISLTFRKVLY